MMFKKWRITGLNKAKHIVATVLVAVLLMGLPVSAAKPEDFTDLKADKWYYEEVSKAITLGLFNGQSETLFGVDGQMTRAEFVTALSRLCGAKIEDYSNDRFTDVLPEHWHYHAVSWAFQEGLVNGISETEFAPNRPVNRLEMCKMLSNAIELVFKKELTTEGAAVFTDQEKITWGLEFAQKCNAAGIFKGDDLGNFNPFQQAPRHQAACVFYRCHDLLEKWVPEEPETPADPETPVDPEAPIDPETPTDPETPEEPEYPPIDPKDYSLTVSGFELSFDVNNDYYLAQPEDFRNCKITGYTGFEEFKVTVEQYASYYPYKNTAYKLGDPLKLGNGRAKITLDVTLKNGEEREYLIALTDPDAADYAYARARIVAGENNVKMYAKANASSTVLYTFVNNARVYYLKTEGDWYLVEQLSTGKQGYIKKGSLKWTWQEVAMPERYRTAIEALKATHPNWSFTFVDVERDYNEYIETVTQQRAKTRVDAEGYTGEEYQKKLAEYIALYKPTVETNLDPLYYLNEDRIYSFLNIDVYDNETWNDAGIAAIWAKEDAITKVQATEYFNAASKSLLMNPYYIACRAALESDYGTSKFAKGTVSGYEGYYNFFGIQCYDSNPTVGASYAKNRNWNSVFRSIVEGANWVKDQYLDQGAITPYFFRYAGFQNKAYMSDLEAPGKEAAILKRAFSDPNAKAHFVIPVYDGMPDLQVTE